MTVNIPYFPAMSYIKNFNYDQHKYSSHISKLLFMAQLYTFALFAWRQLPGWSRDILIFWCKKSKQPISRENFSEVFRLWWCAFITHCAHSFCPNSLSYFSCLCLSSSLLCVCLPFICCHSVFVWTDISLSLLVTQSPPHGYAGFGQACVLACTCLFACSLTFTFTHVLFAEEKPRFTPWCQKGRERKWIGWERRAHGWNELIHLYCMFTMKGMKQNRSVFFLTF